jgi:hypothetical protein
MVGRGGEVLRFEAQTRAGSKTAALACPRQSVHVSSRSAPRSRKRGHVLDGGRRSGERILGAAAVVEVCQFAESGVLQGARCLVRKVRKAFRSPGAEKSSVLCLAPGLMRSSTGRPASR